MILIIGSLQTLTPGLVKLHELPMGHSSSSSLTQGSLWAAPGVSLHHSAAVTCKPAEGALRSSLVSLIRVCAPVA